MTDKYVKELETVDAITPITKNWDELSIEELEERLELYDCEIYCSKNNHK